MLFLIDVGNTNIVMGVYDKDKHVRDWRIRTVADTTEDEFNALVKNLFADAKITPNLIKKTVISCVVPPIIGILNKFCKKYLGHNPLWVDPKTCGVMPILYKNPAEVGADRIVNGVAAYNKYKSSLIVVDFGTATTFDAISEKGEYLGGAISPGVTIAAEALFKRASKLPRVDIFTPPENIIGKDTIESIKSGIIYGYAGLVEGIIKRMSASMGTDPMVVATGGLAELMAKVTDVIKKVEPDLTLEGLKYIGTNFYRNEKNT
ncbi:MAG: type III pantothenate kinase [Deltaproteobacteria bacterium]|nr:type III pantothenate kinase [Deltaproteobacteria bacterium]